MEFIIENLASIICIIAVIFVVVGAAILFFNKPHEEQVEKLREWLLYATCLAERELGGGTGRLKLRFVYDMFVVKFPWLAKIISFELFSELVDDALSEMNDLIDTNSAIHNYIVGEEKTI